MQKRECDIRLSKKGDVVSVIGDVSMKYNYIIILNKSKRDITLPVVIIQCDYIWNLNKNSFLPKKKRKPTKKNNVT